MLSLGCIKLNGHCVRKLYKYLGWVINSCSDSWRDTIYPGEREPPSFLDRRLRRQMERRSRCLALSVWAVRARGEKRREEMGFQASLSGYLTSEGRGARVVLSRERERGPDACQPCRCLLKINQLYVGSKPLISEQENGLAIKLERGRIHCLSSLYIPWLLHFCPHLYLSVRSQGSNTGC